MTLPANGTITMTMVKNELVVNFPLNLAASNVRTLFGKPTGTINLTDGYGKSNQTRWYATSYTGTASTPTYAYDREIADNVTFDYTLFTTAAIVYSPAASNGYTEFILYFGNIATSKVMKLVIAIVCSNTAVVVPTYYADCGGGLRILSRTYNPSPAARITIEVSTDGINYNPPAIDVTSSLAKYFANLGSYSGTDVRLRFRAYGQGIPYDIWYDIGSGCDTLAGSTSSSSQITIFTALME